MMKESGVPVEKYQPVASHWQALSHNVVSSKPCHEHGFEFTTLVVLGTHCTCSCKSNYHMTPSNSTYQCLIIVMLNKIYQNIQQQN